MSVAAVMLVKDEADVIAYTIAHLRRQVDHVIVADNLSTDGTYETLQQLALEDDGARLDVLVDEEVGYRQAEKTTRLARVAADAGHSWVVPADADEFWYSPHGRIADVLEAVPEDECAWFASAKLLNHIATGYDHDEANPFVRLGWRLVEPNPLPKVAARTSPTLEIGMGNHDAAVSALIRSNHETTIADLLVVHHYPWRSEKQFLRKITNGARAYAAAPEIAEFFGSHWRAFGMPEDDGFAERVVGWFREWGYRLDPSVPHVGGELVYDPPPEP